MELISREDFLKHQNDRETVRKTAQQVIKDFAFFNIEVRFPEELSQAYNDLFDQLTVIVAHMLSENSEKLYAILYQIDLSEAAIRKGVAQMNNLTLNDVITHLILERELKKVLTRKYFSEGNL
jgi:hypothetical protein